MRTIKQPSKSAISLPCGVSMKEYNTPIGTVTVVCSNGNIINLFLPRQKVKTNVETDTEKAKKLKWDIAEDHTQNTAALTAAGEWLNAYFDAKKPSVHYLPLSLAGTDFMLSVLRLLLEIPYGEVVTYGELASQISSMRGIPQMSAQAVGGAVSRNPIPIIIPCHRVVDAHGKLVGYSGGLDIKTKLLIHEGVDISRYHII